MIWPSLMNVGPNASAASRSDREICDVVATLPPSLADQPRHGRRPESSDDDGRPAARWQAPRLHQRRHGRPGARAERRQRPPATRSDPGRGPTVPTDRTRPIEVAPGRRRACVHQYPWLRCQSCHASSMAARTGSANGVRHTRKSGSHGSGSLYTTGEPSMRLTCRPAASATAAGRRRVPLVHAAGVNVDVGQAGDDGHRLGAGGAEREHVGVDRLRGDCGHERRPRARRDDHRSRALDHRHVRRGFGRQRDAERRQADGAGGERAAIPQRNVDGPVGAARDSPYSRVPSSGSMIHTRSLVNRRGSSSPSSDSTASSGRAPAAPWRGTTGSRRRPRPSPDPRRASHLDELLAQRDQELSRLPTPVASPARCRFRRGGLVHHRGSFANTGRWYRSAAVSSPGPLESDRWGRVDFRRLASAPRPAGEEWFWYLLAGVTYVGLGIYHKFLLNWIVGPLWLVAVVVIGPAVMRSRPRPVRLGDDQ